MESVQFILDAQGNKKAVQLDLEKWGELWEDFYDAMIVRSRQDESTVSWEDVK